MSRLYVMAFILDLLWTIVLGTTCYLYGEASMRRATVVRWESPVYDGVYFGRCAWILPGDGQLQACATDRREDARPHPVLRQGPTVNPPVR